MPEVKNIFVGAKMNKDLNPRMISNQEYIDARNAAVINSEGSDSGLLQNVSGNTLLTDFGLTGINLEIIGFYIDTTNERIFAFITDWNDTSTTQLSNFASSNSSHYICVFDTKTNLGTVLVSGNFLNFSKTHPVIGINLLENLLFFTDNRNQPRKINVETAVNNSTYYSTEDTISVAKYYPWQPISLTKIDENGKLKVGTSIIVTTNAKNITDGTYTTSSYSTSGSGTAQITFTVTSGIVSNVNVDTSGSGFLIGDTITVTSSFLLNASNDVTVTLQRDNMLAYSSMLDATSKYLPFTQTLNIFYDKDDSAGFSNPVPDPTNTSFVTLTVTPASSPSGFAIEDPQYIIDRWVGAILTVSRNLTEIVSPSDKVVITAVEFVNDGDYGVGNTEWMGYKITHSALPNSLTVEQGDVVIFGANPNYEENFSGDKNLLSDKFVRFSYRFKYDDGEYSLAAPFTQIAFIPKQDGYFIASGDPTSINDELVESDENAAIRSTIIDFFENKVNSIGLSIPLPRSVLKVKDLISTYKVKEIDILYTESDLSSIKVIDTIDSINLNLNNNQEFYYTYNSQKPIKTLPQKESTRASDKVPIRAKAQEVAGNRVIYGNYLVRTTRPNNLSFSVSVGQKSSVSNSNSYFEYPNHQLKQNRNYKCGVVLVDKFGRQSDVISSNKSTIYNEYKSIPENLIYYGDSLILNFDNIIPVQLSSPGYAGLYSETNPNGWYSYKVVVQQTEQEYYNLYLPTILNSYPQKAATNKILTSNLSFITLFSDNINKMPRDLKEVGPSDINYTSSIEFFPRVNSSCFQSGQSYNLQIIPNITSSSIIKIGTRDEIGVDTTQGGDNYDLSPFYSIPEVPIKATATNNRLLNLGANPYIASVNSIKNIYPTGIGATGGKAQTKLKVGTGVLGVKQTNLANLIAGSYYGEIGVTPGFEMITNVENGYGLKVRIDVTNSSTIEKITVVDPGVNYEIDSQFTYAVPRALGGDLIQTYTTAIDDYNDSADITFENLSLNVIETKPIQSKIDIYYETTTSGLISDLNSEILQTPNIYTASELSNFNFFYEESFIPESYATGLFDVLNNAGQSLTSNVSTSIVANILNVRDGNGNNVTSSGYFELEQDIATSQWRLKTTPSTYFIYQSGSNTSLNFEFTFEFEVTILGVPGSITSSLILPSNQVSNTEPITIPSSTYTIPFAESPTQIISSNTVRNLYSLTAKNGTYSSAYQDYSLGLLSQILFVSYYDETQGIYVPYKSNINPETYIIGEIFSISNENYIIKYNDGLTCINNQNTLFKVEFGAIDCSGVGVGARGSFFELFFTLLPDLSQTPN
jgi:hypothetical protein